MNMEKPQIPEELDKGIKKLIGTLKKSMKLISDHHAKRAIGTELTKFIETYKKLGGEF